MLFINMTSSEEYLGNFTDGPIQVEKIFFHWFDYSLFAFMLGISAAIGVYFGFFKKQENVVDYILGGKTMHTLPIAISMIASEVSGMEFIGIPADLYTYGISYWWTMISIVLAGIVTYYIYLPVFYKLQLTSSFEYLKLRFDNKNCIFATFLLVLSWLLTMPITIYIPALTFSQVTDLNVHMITPVMCIICIFYTTVGGLKAVVWTDTLQFTMMCFAMVFVLSVGAYNTGGIKYIFEKSYEGGRIFLDFDPDPTNRTAFWSPCFGMFFSWLSLMAASQVCTQKFQALPSFENVKRAMLTFIIGLVLVKSTTSFTGLIIYARYAACDPVTTGSINNSDQLLPFYLMDVVGKIPGLPGLFVAGIFCAALSTMSTDLNTLSGLIYEDFVKPYMPEDTAEKRASDVMKGLVVGVGVFTTTMVYIVEHLGSVYPLAASLNNLAAGPLLAMFSLGMLVPIANSKGTLTGAISGLIIMGWLVFGAQYHTSKGGVPTPKLPTSVDGCAFVVNQLNSTVAEPAEYLPQWIYRISFYYYSLIGFTVTMIMGVVVSFFTGGRYQKVDRDLLSPSIYFLLSTEDKEEYIMNKIDNVVR